MGNCRSSPAADDHDTPLQATREGTSQGQSIPVSSQGVAVSLSSFQHSRTESGRESPLKQATNNRVNPAAEEAPPSTGGDDLSQARDASRRYRAKSAPQKSSRNTDSSMNAESSNSRRMAVTSPLRKPLTSTVRQALPEHFKFRILVVGKRGSGKSSLINAVFKVDVTAAPEIAPGKADIDVEFRPADNRYLIVHECSGLDSPTTDSQDMQTIQNFISRRTDANRSHSERLHAIWICVPASDAIDGRLGDGVEEILGTRNVPVILVFTKFDVVVSRVLFDIAGGDAQHLERARDIAPTMYEEACRRMFHKEPRDVPAEIVSEKGRFIDLVDNLVVTTDRFVIESHSSALDGAQGAQRVGAIPLAWSAAVRVNHDIIIKASIEVGRSRYWLNLCPEFASHTLQNCVDIIHDDIVEIWNINDKTGYLSSDGFKARMSHLVKDLAKSNPTSGSRRKRAGGDYADWVRDIYGGSQRDVRCVMGYIVDLTVILYGIFRTTAVDMSPNLAEQVVKLHAKSGRREAIHRDIRNFVSGTFAMKLSAPEKDLFLERIIDLIKQFCVPPSTNDSLSHT
ncbi:hypothetical protein EI94DRAFT_1804007 [Lactarius quietus]|nr:hypothetical protein EI94DRAFT_1804007 [Lactarius quietus]